MRQQLKADHWFIVGFDQLSGHRPDFLACKEGNWILVASRVGALEKAAPDNLDVAAKRLAAFADGPPVASRLIVMLDPTRGEVSNEVPREVREKVELVSLEEISGECWQRALAGPVA